MLMVVKRSGKEEAFDLQKIKNTLAIASDELGRPLSQSDINMITEPVTKAAEGKETITSQEIYYALMKSMDVNGFPWLAKAYRENKGNYRD